METERGIAVVGGGPAGLSAAWRLVTSGRRVVVYDPAVGGRLRTEAVAGVRADVGVQLLADSYVETLALARAVGAGDLLERAPGRDGLWRGGRAHALRYGSVASMAASGAIPAGLKLKLGLRYMPFLETRASRLALHDLRSVAAAGLDGESLAAWGGRSLGRDFVELLAYPLLAAYYGVAPESVSAGFFHALSRSGTHVSVYGVRGGMGALVSAIRGALEGRGTVFRPEAVTAVEAGPDGVVVSWSGGSSRHDAAVLAVPPARLRGLASLPAPLAGWLDGVRTAPFASLALALDGLTPASWFGLAVPRGERPGDTVAAVCVQERKAPGMVPEGRSAMVVYPAPALGAELAAAEPEEAFHRLIPAVERLLPGTRARVAGWRHVAFPAGGVVPYPGYAEHLAALELDALPARLALAGDYLMAPTVEGAVRSGGAAAERLLALTPG